MAIDSSRLEPIFQRLGAWAACEHRRAKLGGSGRPSRSRVSSSLRTLFKIALPPVVLVDVRGEPPIASCSGRSSSRGHSSTARSGLRPIAR